MQPNKSWRIIWLVSRFGFRVPG